MSTTSTVDVFMQYGQRWIIDVDPSTHASSARLVVVMPATASLGVRTLLLVAARAAQSVMALYGIDSRPQVNAFHSDQDATVLGIPVASRPSKIVFGDGP